MRFVREVEQRQGGAGSLQMLQAMLHAIEMDAQPCTTTCASPPSSRSRKLDRTDYNRAARDFLTLLLYRSLPETLDKISEETDEQTMDTRARV
jgi:hypothetical protein